ncbi:MAG: right-handed parallel beta-helix repeat-containing protein [Candidatus Bathyarchaeota archaeon]|nr:right-handed parallel beta-helix repeat-containing protein [Candidatus Bathyarchaeota archaeon]
MSKSIVLLLVFVFLTGLCLILPVPVKAASKTIVVPDDYASIQDAIDNASDGDTIFIKKGVYVENPVVNKSVSLVGEDRATTVIDVTAGIKVQKDGVTITGLTIYDGYDGISVAANYCNISGNKITSVTHGIVVFGYENSISGNIFESVGLSSAIQLNFANKNLINKNHIVSCVEGIQIWQNSNNNTITENTITNCQYTAIIFQNSNYNVIIGNNISHSGLGTSIYGSNNNTISNNNYFDNGVQFSAKEDYYLSFGYNRSVNIIDENYWSDYKGADANGDGIGDTPYVVDEYNQDNRPLMEPIDISQTLLPPPTPSSTTDPSTIPSSPETNQELSPIVNVVVASLVITVVVTGALIYLKKNRCEAKNK